MMARSVYHSKRKCGLIASTLRGRNLKRYLDAAVAEVCPHLPQARSIPVRRSVAQQDSPGEQRLTRQLSALYVGGRGVPVARGQGS